MNSEKYDQPLKYERTAPADVEPSRRDAVEDWLTLFVRMLGLPASETEAVRDELEDHLRSRVDDLLIVGLTEPEAVRRAVSELGETATLAQGFRNARRRPRKWRMMMHVTLFAVAGSALVLSTTALYNGGGSGNGIPYGGLAAAQPEVVAIEGEAAEVAPFNENLRRYDISGMIPEYRSYNLGVQSDGTRVYQTNESAISDRIEEITDTIQAFVDFDRWQNNGGDEGQLRTVGNTLFVDAPAEMHEGVVWVLQSLREDVERAKVEAKRAIEESARARDEVARARRAEAENERRERETRIEREAAELEEQYQRLTQQIVELNREKLLIEIKRSGNPFDAEPAEEKRQGFAELQGELVRIGIEIDTAEAQLVRTRDLLLDRQFQRYEAVGTPAPLPTPASGRSPVRTGEIIDVPAPSGR